jgi:hypothetical protein
VQTTLLGMYSCIRNQQEGASAEKTTPAKWLRIVADSSSKKRAGLAVTTQERSRPEGEGKDENRSLPPDHVRPYFV